MPLSVIDYKPCHILHLTHLNIHSLDVERNLPPEVDHRLLRLADVDVKAVEIAPIDEVCDNTPILLLIYF